MFKGDVSDSNSGQSVGLEVQVVPLARHAEQLLVEFRHNRGAQHWLLLQTLPETPQQRPPVHEPLQQSVLSAQAAPSTRIWAWCSRC